MKTWTSASGWSVAINSNSNAPLFAFTLCWQGALVVLFMGIWKLKFSTIISNKYCFSLMDFQKMRTMMHIWSSTMRTKNRDTLIIPVSLILEGAKGLVAVSVLLGCHMRRTLLILNFLKVYLNYNIIFKNLADTSIFIVFEWSFIIFLLDSESMNGTCRLCAPQAQWFHYR